MIPSDNACCDATLANRLLTEGMRTGQSFDLLARILSVGPRQTASQGAAQAVDLTRTMMQEMGFDEVHLEPVTVRRWVRATPESAVATLPDGAEVPLTVAALGGSVGTPPDGLEAQVIEVLDIEALKKLDRSQVEGRIVFFNRPFDHGFVDTFSGYGASASARVHGASEAARKGGVAALVRSVASNVDDNPHTGIMLYAADTPTVPAIAISVQGALQLSQLLQQHPDLRLQLISPCYEDGTAESFNVVGQITGSTHPSEVILVGGHLDSWDLGPGAHDDGAGCAQALEVLRLLKAMGLQPKRTIRAVMFMDEEMGGTGGKAYATDPRRKKEKHVAAIESDRGAFRPLGFTVRAEAARVTEYARQWMPFLEPLGILFVKEGYGGVDINPLHEFGTLTIGLYPDSQRYFDLHHSANDTLDKVNPRELQMGAVAMAGLAWLLANAD